MTPSPKQKDLKAELERKRDDLKHHYDSLAASLGNAQREWEEAVAGDVAWRPLRPTQVTSQGGATCTILDDGSVLVSGKRPDVDTYTIRTKCDAGRITALRLEALPDPSLPGGKAGRADDGGFAVSKVQVFQEPIRPAENVKYVRVELPRHDYLTISEVQVFRGDENVALNKSATQSSTAYEGWAKLAVDGSTHPHFSTGRSISHTAFNDHPWWEVDLGEPTRVDRITLWNEEGHPDRMAGARVSLLDSERKPVWQHTLRFSPDLTTTLTVDDVVPQFAWASADSEQKDFPARHAIESHNPAQHGWSPAPQATGPQSLVLGFEQPVGAEHPYDLKIVVDQQVRLKDRPGQSLGHFRLLATDDPNAARTATVPPDIRKIAQTPADNRTPEETEKLTKYYRSLVPELTRIAALQEDLERRFTEELKPDKTPIMKELPPDKQRTTHMFVRGSFLNPGDVVEPGHAGSLSRRFRPTRRGIAWGWPAGWSIATIRSRHESPPIGIGSSFSAPALC